MDAEYAGSAELPEPVIHHIQSFLTPKESARTILLSKSWGTAWSTRPTIVLDESHFPRDLFSKHPKIDGLPDFARTTFRRYEESNLTIDSFRLCIYNESYARFGLATEWTLKALKLGATDLTFRIYHPDIAIPLSEALASGNVARLCLERSDIDRIKVVECPGLKSLTLIDSIITRDSFFDIVSCCRSIENLSLSNITGRIYKHSDDPPTFSLHKLRSLVLCRLASQFQIKPLFLGDMSTKFPNLKDLTLELSLSDVAFFRNQQEIQSISCRSLEVLNFVVGTGKGDYDKQKKMPRFEFDVPSIRKFTLECSYMPNLCFQSSSMDLDQCESHVSLKQQGRFSNMWFFKLRKFLTELRWSKIHLCLRVGQRSSFHYQPGDIKSLNVRELENLTMYTEGLSSPSFNALLDGLFRISRPKIITQNFSPTCNIYDGIYVDDGEGTINHGVVLCRAKGTEVKSLLIPSHCQHMYCLRDCNVQKLFDGVWRPQPLDSILDDSTSEQRRLRFQFKWKPS